MFCLSPPLLFLLCQRTEMTCIVADSRLFSPPHADATTAVAWTTTPKSASCLHSQKSVISARALTTWLQAAQSKHNSPRRVLRESRLPPEETKSIATRRRRATALIRRETGLIESSWEAQRLIKLLRWRDGKIRSLSSCWSCFWNYLRLKKKDEIVFVFAHDEVFFVCLSFGVTLRNTAVLLHSGRFLKESLLFCQGFWNVLTIQQIISVEIFFYLWAYLVGPFFPFYDSEC